MEALEAGDNRAVWVTAEPHKIPLHNFYEFIWFLKTGGPRLVTGQDCLLENTSTVCNLLLCSASDADGSGEV